MKTFNKLPRLIQLILLLIPGVNYVVEIVVRVSEIFYKINLKSIIGRIFGVFIPILKGWIVCVWVVLFKHLIFAK